MSWHGIRTVATLELRQRVRTSKWPIVLGIWVALIALVAFLSYWATNDEQLRSGEAMYDIVIFFVLGLAMLIVPSLTATSVNGDRESGVLATLQTTLLTHWDIVLGKLAAAWVISMAFLVTALPFMAWAWFEGGVSGGRIVLSLVVLVLVLAVVCTLGLMFSTLTARPIASAVLTYLADRRPGLRHAHRLRPVGLPRHREGTAAGLRDLRQLVRDAPAPGHRPRRPHPHPGADRPADEGRASPPGRTARPSPARPRSPTPSGSGGCCRSTRSSWSPTPRPRCRASAATTYSSGFTPMRWISVGARVARSAPRTCWTSAPCRRRRMATARRAHGVGAEDSAGVAVRAGVPAAGRDRRRGSRRTSAPDADPAPAERHPHRLTPARSGVQRVELGLGDGLLVGVEPDVAEQGLQHAQGRGRPLAPVGQVAELPPPAAPRTTGRRRGGAGRARGRRRRRRRRWTANPSSARRRSPGRRGRRTRPGPRRGWRSPVRSGSSSGSVVSASKRSAGMMSWIAASLVPMTRACDSASRVIGIAASGADARGDLGHRREVVPRVVGRLVGQHPQVVVHRATAFLRTPDRG